MSRYVLEFSKQGYIKYISHLDLQRLFKRAIKRTAIPLEYSKGFNPHPKMGFAQPLSLGYTASHEYLEFTTYEPIDAETALIELREAMPQGININYLKELTTAAKSLAAVVSAALYQVILPIDYRSRHKDIEEMVVAYLNQPSIMAKKREKKTKKFVDKDIKNQIREINVISTDDLENKEVIENIDGRKIVLEMMLDSGSQSNLSPEQVISSFTEFSELYLPREDIDVERKKIFFDIDFP